MAFSNSLTSRLDDLRSRNSQFMASEPSPGYTIPARYSGSFMPTHSQSSSDARGNLQRRFTTDMTKMPPPQTPIGQPPNQPSAESAEISSTTLHKVQLLEKKRKEYEMLREQRRRFEVEFELFNLQQAREEEELDQMALDLQTTTLSSGHQSEPTTPPEHRDHGFPSVFSRNNRYSASSLASPPGLNSRPGRSGSQITSPPTEIAQTLHNHINSDTLPSKSVPGSRRGSNDRVSVYVPETNGKNPHIPASTNRYSMPVTGTRNRYSGIHQDHSSVLGLGHINTTGFLFGDDDEKAAAKKESATSPDVKSYLQMNATDDKFPILVRREEFPGLLSASSAALDLALSQSPGPESQPNDWPSFANRHRHSQHSLPQNIFNGQSNSQLGNITSSSGFQNSSEAVASSRPVNRHSMESSLAPFSQTSLPSQVTATDNARPILANIQSSFSTSDLPTVKTVNGLGGISSPTKTQAQQHFHNHNASLGRIPPHAVNNRHSRELAVGETRREEQNNTQQYYNSLLQASAAPFGPSSATVSPMESIPVPSGSNQINAGPYAAPAFYGGYGMHLVNMGMGPIPIGNPLTFNNQMQPFPPQFPLAAYQTYGQSGRFPDSQARVIQQRRIQNGEDNARFINVKLEHLQGEIYGLCKDQHGCRYLQKKLEERNQEHVQLIFLETKKHVVELMTDPFGNYLCQKLLEFSNDDQRTVLINNAAPQMVQIALNQHGTRALQKMIQFISTREQIQTIIHALQDRVVDLIQDLNGNHVIQKCLNHLTPDDAQFIFDGVGNHCVVVGTHRHGCCVLQRCIDHASGHQKAQLISQITANAFSLVQDPFGNYVLQYIIDLAEPAFTDPLCYSFQGSIPALSKQKFSSNVIEKCLRGAQASVARMMIEEMLNANELEKMLSDAYANYVVQTALEYADPETKTKLIDAIRPILPSIRQTPYGRRIQNKIMGGESQGRGRLSGLATPSDSSNGQITLVKAMHHNTPASPYGISTMNSFQGVNNTYTTSSQPAYNTNGVLNNIPSYGQTSGPSANLPSHSFTSGSTNLPKYGSDNHQNTVQQQLQQSTSSYPRSTTVNGFNYF